MIKPVWKKGNHPLSQNTFQWLIVNKYRKGKMKRTQKGNEKEPEIKYIQAVEASKEKS